MLVTSWDEIVKRFPELQERADRPEVDAIRQYLKGGGIIKIADDEKKLKITYPTKTMVEERIRKLRQERAYYVKQLQKIVSLDREFSAVRLAFDPLYIKHQMKLLTDRRYREAWGRLGFTNEHFKDPNTRKIIEQFMNDEEYRARVLQALEESPVYKSRNFGDIATVKKSARRAVIQRRKDLIERKIRHLEQQITVLNLLKRWM